MHTYIMYNILVCLEPVGGVCGELLCFDVLWLEAVSLHLLLPHPLLQCGHLTGPLGRLLLLGFQLLLYLGAPTQLCIRE